MLVGSPNAFPLKAKFAADGILPQRRPQEGHGWLFSCSRISSRDSRSSSKVRSQASQAYSYVGIFQLLVKRYKYQREMLQMRKPGEE